MRSPRFIQPKHPRSNSAFTLVEMLAVIAIILIVASFLIPSLKGILRGKEITRAANDISGLLEAARSEAMGKGTYVWVGFTNSVTTTSGTTYQLKVAAVRSIDGSPNFSAWNSNSSIVVNYQPFSSVLSYDNIEMDNLGNLSSKLGTAINSGTVGGIAASGTNFTCQLANLTSSDPPINDTVNSTKGFVIPPKFTGITTSDLQFSNIIIFSPQGEAAAYSVNTKTNDSSGNPVPSNIYITGTGQVPVIQIPIYSSQIFVGLRRIVGGKRLSNDPDSVGIVIFGGTGKNQIYRL